MADPQAISYLYTNPGNSSKRLTIIDFQLDMHPYEHDLAKITIQGSDDTSTAQWDTGVPVAVRYGRQPNTMTNFYGYILTAQPNWSQTLKVPKNNRRMVIWALGASTWPMKQALTGVFLGQTAPQIARSIVEKHNISVNAPTSTNDYTWPMRTALNGQSEWEFLVALAKDSGRTCHGNGTQFNFYDPSNTLTQANPVVPVFHEKDSGKGMTVLDFTPDNSEISAEVGRRKRARIYQGMTRTGQPIIIKDSGTTVPHRFGKRYRTPLFTENVPGITADTPQLAGSLLTARTVENRFYIRAKATLSGNIQVTQQTPIVIEGVGTRDSGLWQVLSVTHHIGWQWYSLECELGRDADFDNGQRPRNPPGVSRTYMTSYGAVPLTTPPTVLSNGVWRSSYKAAK